MYGRRKYSLVLSFAVRVKSYAKIISWISCFSVLCSVVDRVRS